MPKFPEPPGIAKLRTLTPDIHTLRAGKKVARVYFSGGPHPVSWNAFRHYGPMDSRFEHLAPTPAGKPQHQPLGIMYVTSGREALATAVVEVYQKHRTIDCKSRDPALVIFKLSRDLKLLDLTGAFATRMGASMAIHSGDKQRTQRWALQLHPAYTDTDGILYCSSMNSNQPSIALFERAADAIPARPTKHWLLAEPSIRAGLLGIAIRFGYKLT